MKFSFGVTTENKPACYRLLEPRATPSNHAKRERG
jgi:hypothetical protein